MKIFSPLYDPSLPQGKLLNLWHRMSSSLHLRRVGQQKKRDATIQRALVNRYRSLVQAQALQ